LSLNSPQALENTGFIAGELSLIVSLVLYRPVSVYELKIKANTRARKIYKTV